MPELPEVETVRLGLSPALKGARLVRVEARRPDLRFALPEGFVQRLTGATVLDLTRRAKYLLAPLDRGDTLVMHLGMTGRFEVEGGEESKRPGEFHYAVPADPKHAHVVFETDREGRRTKVAKRIKNEDVPNDSGPSPVGYFAYEKVALERQVFAIPAGVPISFYQ